MIKVCPGSDEGAARFRHFLFVNGHETMTMYCTWLAKTCPFQYRWPKQGMKISNVLADKMMQFRGAIDIPVMIKVQIVPHTVVFEARHIADRCV